MSRFGKESSETIDKNIGNIVPINTIKTKNTIWRQFESFCAERNYKLERDTTDEEITAILKDWGFNMKRTNGEDYKENVVKTMWNQVAKIIQEKYFNEFGRTLDPFKGPQFKIARDARDSKRRLLQSNPEKRAVSATAMEKGELQTMIEIWDEDTPEGLQKKFFVIVSVELAWRGGEGSTALIHHFKPELKNDGTESGRIEYNPIFTKTTQGGSKKCAQSKWLMENFDNPENCPVRLFKKLMSKRTEKIKTERLFLTPNPFWKKPGSSGWFKDCPVGRNEFAKWINQSAEKAGLDIKNKKFTNHSSRATAVSTLSKSGVGEQEIMKITGHANSNSIRPYLQLDYKHHEKIVKKMRRDEPSSTAVNDAFTIPPAAAPVFAPVPTPTIDPVVVSGAALQAYDPPKASSSIFNNCTFYCTNFHTN